MTIEERLESMEKEMGRQKRRNRWLLGAILFVAGGLIVPGFIMTTASRARAQEPGTAKEIRARSFILEDENGKTRAGLWVLKDNPILSLSDENGEARAVLYVLKDGPGLMLSDEKEEVRVRLAARKDGPGLVLYDEKGMPRAGLSAIKSGPGLTLSDEKSMIRAGLAVGEFGPDLVLFGPDGKVIWSAIK